MKKLFIIFSLIPTYAFAYYTENIPEQCGVLGDNFVAIFTPNTHNCSNGYFLPAGVDECVSCPYGQLCSGGVYTFNENIDQGIAQGIYACNSGSFLPADTLECKPCPNGYTCSGGTYSFNENEFQGAEKSQTYITHNLTSLCATNAPHKLIAVLTPNIHTCLPGYYLPANVDECTICSLNSICSGGTYSFNETVDQGIQSCSANYYSPTGSTVCYPHILHVGDNNIYLRSTKLTIPSVNIKIGNDIFYANMTTTPTFMNKSSIRYLRVKYNNTDYYVCDDTTCPE